MSDSPWSQLGLEPTNDTRTIRRAYRQRLPEHPPETDPEGFKRLRQAYEEALALATEPQPEPETEAESETATDEAPAQDAADEALQAAQAWFDHLNTLSAAAESRFHITSYQTHLAQLDELPLAAITLLPAPTLDWASQRGYLPKAVLRALRDRFQWPQLVNRYEPQEALEVDRFLTALDQDDPFNLEVLSSWPSHAQEGAIRLFAALAHGLRHGDVNSLRQLLYLPAVHPLPPCPRALWLLLRCYQACQLPVPDAWLATARTLHQCADLATELDRDWLLASLLAHSGQTGAALAVMTPHLSAGAAPDLRSWLFRLFQHQQPEWLPLWTLLLRPDLNDPVDAGDTLQLLAAQRQLLEREDSDALMARLCIRDGLCSGFRYGLPPSVDRRHDDPVTLSHLYGWLMQLQQGVTPFDTPFDASKLDLCGLQAQLPDDYPATRLALALLHEHQQLLSAQRVLQEGLDQPELAHELQTRPVSVRQRILARDLTRPLPELQRLAEAAELNLEVDDDQQGQAYEDRLDWIRRRLHAGDRHWCSRASLPTDPEAAMACQRLGLVLDMEPAWLLEPFSQPLLQTVAEQPEDSVFRLLARTLLAFQQQEPDADAVKELCRQLVLPLTDAGLRDAFARLLNTPRMITHLMNGLYLEPGLPDASWAPVMTALLGTEPANGIDPLYYHALLTLRPAQAPPALTAQVKQHTLALDNVNLRGQALLSDALNMPIAELKALKIWQTDELAYTGAALNTLAALSSSHPSQWPHKDDAATLLQTYRGETEDSVPVRVRLLCGLILGQLEHHLTTLKQRPGDWSSEPWRRPFSFRGRLSRLDFFLHTLTVMTPGLGLQALYPDANATLISLLMMAGFVAFLSGMTRRLRDIGLHGRRLGFAVPVYLVLLVAVPPVAIIILLFKGSAVPKHSLARDDQPWLTQMDHLYQES